MKIVITKKEYKAGLILIEKVGYEVDLIEEIIAQMQDDTRVVISKETKTLTLENQEVLDEMNDLGKKFLVVTKSADDFTFDINEEFVVEATTIYGEGIIKIVRGISGIVRDMASFMGFSMQPFLDKWS